MHTFANDLALFVFVTTLIHTVDVINISTNPQMECPILGNNSDNVFNKEQWICDKLKLCSPVLNYVCCETCQCNFNCSGSEGSCFNDRETKSTNDIMQVSYSCENDQYLSTNNGDLTGDKYLLITACKSFVKRKTLKEYCLNTENTENVFKKIPVTSDNGLSYRNKFCALCNYEAKFTYWKAEVKCSDTYIYGNSFSDIVEQVRQSNKQCNILFSPRSNANVTKCDLFHECAKVVTIQISSETCAVYTSIIDRNLRNVLCFRCSSHSHTGQGDYPYPSLFTGFSALLNFNEQTPTEIKENNCGNKQIYDKYTGTCLSFGCMPPGVIRNNSCSSIYETMSNINYEIFIKVNIASVDSGVPVACKNCIEKLVSELKSVLLGGLESSIEKLCDVTFYVNINHINQSDLKIISIIIREQFYFSSAEKHSYVDVLSEIILSVPSEFNTTILENEITLSVFVDSRVYTPVDILGHGYTFYVDPHDGHTLALLHYYKIYANVYMCFTDSKRITIHNLRLCLNVNITKETFKLRFTKQNICIADVQLCIPPDQYRDNGQFVTICIEKYREFVQLFAIKFSEYSSNRFEEILSLTCTILSVMSLITVIITYSIFRCLRTLPGYNNMTLCTWLLLAHLFYQFGMKRTHLGVGCVILGLLTHFFWLQAFAWQTICCGHAYRVFASKNGFSFATSSPHKTYIVYSVASFIYVSVFMSINIVIKTVRSDQTNVGYGGKLCYISDPLMIAVTFALPLSLSVVTNIILILIVFMKIYQMPEIKKNVKNERNNLKIFAKLSTLTGITWIFGFIYEWTNVIALLYIFVILTSLQGVFLMISFVFSDRIFRLYKSYFFRNQKHEIKQSSQLSSTYF